MLETGSNSSEHDDIRTIDRQVFAFAFAGEASLEQVGAKRLRLVASLRAFAQLGAGKLQGNDYRNYL
jgi:hypothetical protein